MEKADRPRRRDILLSIVCIGIIIWFVWNLFVGLYIIALTLLSLLFFALAFSLIQQVLSFRVVVTKFFINLPDQFKYLDDFLVKRGIPQANIDDAINQVRGQLVGFAQTAATNVVNVAFVVTSAFIDILLILVLSFYFTLDGRNIRHNLVKILPE